MSPRLRRGRRRDRDAGRAPGWTPSPWRRWTATRTRLRGTGALPFKPPAYAARRLARASSHARRSTAPSSTDVTAGRVGAKGRPRADALPQGRHVPSSARASPAAAARRASVASQLAHVGGSRARARPNASYAALRATPRIVCRDRRAAGNASHRTPQPSCAASYQTPNRCRITDPSPSRRWRPRSLTVHWVRGRRGPAQARRAAAMRSMTGAQAPGEGAAAASTSRTTTPASVGPARNASRNAIAAMSGAIVILCSNGRRCSDRSGRQCGQ